MARDGGRRDRASLRTSLAALVAGLAILPAAVAWLSIVAATDTVPSTLQGWLAPAAWFAALSLGAWWLGAAAAKGLLRPVENLLDWLRRAAAHRGAGRQVPPLNTDGAPREVTELTQGIEAVLEALQRELGQRDVLVGALVHDMKTPLLAVRNTLSLLRHGDAASMALGERQLLVDEALREIAATLDLIDGVSTAHRLERSVGPSRRERVDLRALVEFVASRLETANRDSKPIRIEVSGACTYANVDASAMQRVIANLVENGTRYAASRVRIEVFPGLVRILDDGPGMVAGEASTFAPYRAGRSANGLGLGLHIAQSILEAHGGRLVVEGTGPGGTTMLAYVGAGEGS